METNNSQALYKIVLKFITESPHSRITFAEYMDLVLYHPEYGYYSSPVVDIGKKGDFFTSVALGKDFGELLAIQLQEMWQKLGYPKLFTVVEMGAGNGNLAKDILSYWSSNNPEIIAHLQYIIVEKSLSLKQIQQAALQEFNGRIDIKWQSWEYLLDDSLVGCCFSNELIDAFAVHQVMIDSDKLQEIYLTVENDSIKEIQDDLSTEDIYKYFDLVAIDWTNREYPKNYRTEVNLAALDWLNTVSKKLQQGYILTIDYGYPAVKYYHPQRSQGTLQCYYQHRRHNNPYVNLGQQDITAHIDFTALENQGKLVDLETLGLTKQGMFLMALGIGDRLTELSSGKYNVMEILQRRDALHQLINPMGLGDFGVLIQGKNLTKDQSILQGLNIN
ncbi:MAG: class I SAM-dependent methyltransferase [Xenococcaceae cyanobacterium MO_207.B15]|nr:class I SAM-dependent methyltransferase [Xenococcaceae cyanobacterium MO_207.B15]